MRSLSTSQLVVLWYGGIIISFILWDSYNEIYKVLGVAALAALLIFTLNPHPNANKRKVFLWVVLPVPLTLGLIYSSAQVYEQYKETACRWALEKISSEEKNAVLDSESLGKQLKEVLQSHNFSSAQSDPFFDSSKEWHFPPTRFIEKEISVYFPGFKNCNYEKKQEIANYWYSKFGKNKGRLFE